VVRVLDFELRSQGLNPTDIYSKGGA